MVKVDINYSILKILKLPILSSKKTGSGTVPDIWVYNTWQVNLRMRYSFSTHHQSVHMVQKQWLLMRYNWNLENLEKLPDTVYSDWVLGFLLQNCCVKFCFREITQSVKRDPSWIKSKGCQRSPQGRGIRSSKSFPEAPQSSLRLLWSLLPPEVTQWSE